MSLNIHVREDSGVSVIEVSGRLTLGGGPTRLQGEIRRLLDEGKKDIVINLGRLTYMDSSGMGLLVGAYATVNREGGHLKLSNLTRRVKDLLLVTKLYTVFEIHGDEPDAVRSFAASAR